MTRQSQPPSLISEPTQCLVLIVPWLYTLFLHWIMISRLRAFPRHQISSPQIHNILQQISLLSLIPYDLDHNNNNKALSHHVGPATWIIQRYFALLVTNYWARCQCSLTSASRSRGLSVGPHFIILGLHKQPETNKHSRHKKFIQSSLYTLQTLVYQLLAYCNYLVYCDYFAFKNFVTTIVGDPFILSIKFIFLALKFQSP